MRVRQRRNQLQHPRQRRKGARHHGVERLFGLQRFDACMPRDHIGEAQQPRDVIDEAQLLVHCVNQRELAGWIDDRQRQAGKSGAGAHIGDAHAFQVRMHAQRIEQVMRQHLARIGDGSEVVGLVPAQQFRSQRAELTELRGIQIHAQSRGALAQTGAVDALHRRLHGGALRTNWAMNFCTGMSSI